MNKILFFLKKNIYTNLKSVYFKENINLDEI